MRRIIQIVALLLLVIGLIYLGACIYSNYFAPQEGELDMPSENQAAYSLVVKNTATIILTNNCEVFGSEIGNRTFYLTGYWELIGSEFRYRDSNLTLPESVFGQIEYKRR